MSWTGVWYGILGYEWLGYDWGMIHCTVCLWCCCVSGATYTMLWITGGLTVYSVFVVLLCFRGYIQSMGDGRSQCSCSVSQDNFIFYLLLSVEFVGNSAVELHITLRYCMHYNNWQQHLDNVWTARPDLAVCTYFEELSVCVFSWQQH